MNDNDDHIQCEILLIEGMMCQKNCGTTVKNALQSVDGVKQCVVSFTHGAAMVLGGFDTQEIIEAVEMVGFDAELLRHKNSQYRNLREKLEPLLEETHVFQVSGMMCQKNCGTTVRNALLGVKNVRHVVVSFSESAALVRGTGLSDEDLIDAIEMVGFDASVVQDEEQRDYLMNALVPQSVVRKMSLEDVCEFIPESRNSFSLPQVEIEMKPRRRTSETSIEIRPRRTSGVYRRAEFAIHGMTCTACVANVEKNIGKVAGVKSVVVALISERATIMYDTNTIDATSIASEIKKLGYEANIIEENMNCASDGFGVGVIDVEVLPHTSIDAIIFRLENTDGIVSVTEPRPNALKVKYAHESMGARRVMYLIQDDGSGCSLDRNVNREDASHDAARYYRNMFFGSLLFTFPILVILYICPAIPNVYTWLLTDVGHMNMKWHGILLWAFSTPIQFGFGGRFYRNALNAIMHGSTNMDVLVVLGTSAAYLYSMISMLSDIYNGSSSKQAMRDSSFFETSAMLITFILLGKYLETSARTMTASAIAMLMRLQTDTALLVEAHDHPASNPEKEIDLCLVEVGDVLKVLPGHRVPVDGVVVSGKSEVDESMLTGESIPIWKGPGDKITGSTVNGHGVLIMKAARVGSDTALAQIVKLVEEAQSTKAPIQDFADRISSYFVPIVVAISFSTFITWSVLMWYVQPAFLQDIPQEQRVLMSVKFGIAVLVISCPCALGLATPTAVMVSTGVGAKYGILIKGGDSLESAAGVTRVILDKTGTITEGKATVTGSLTLGQTSTNELFRIAASAERASEHVIARAVVKHTETLGVVSFYSHLEFEAKPGYGIDCTLENGIQVLVGNIKFLKLNHVDYSDPRIEAFLSTNEKMGTVVLCATRAANQPQFEMIGAIAVCDPVKANAPYVVDLLQSMGIAVFMCSGDNATTANAVAEQCGIPPANVFANCLPNQKVNRVRKLQSFNDKVAMVGDGINDSPALTAADIGIAVGAGTDIAIECADAVLMRNDLTDVAVYLHLAKKTIQRIKLNLFFSFVYNVLCIPLAAGVFYPSFKITLPPMLAGFMMAMSSVTVVGSSLLLRLYRPPSSHLVSSPQDGSARVAKESWWKRTFRSGGTYARVAQEDNV